MKKKIIITLVSFMLVIGSIFSFIPRGVAKADSFIYGGELVSDTSVLPDYAVTSVETFIYENRCEFKLILDSSKLSSDIYLFYFVNNYSIGNVSNIESITFNIPIDKTINDANNPFYGLFGVYFYSYNQSLQIFSSSTTSFIYISPNSGEYQFTFAFSVTHILNSSNYDLSRFVDMNSDYNYFEMFNFSTNTIFSSLYKFYSNGTTGLDIWWNFYSNSLSSFYYDKGGQRFDLKNSLSYVYFVSCSQFLNSSFTSVYRYYMLPGELRFEIYRPTKRVNNMLVLYNYNFSYLQNFSSIDYVLRKNDNYFTVQYMSSIPNEYYIIITCDEIQNKIFDEYISLTISNTMSVSSYNLLSDSYIIENGSIKCTFGFDFNFTYYADPLVASNGSYNFEFKKPPYVEMKFSLYPFYIPVLEAVENIFIFLIFYCPIISDILELLCLDIFIGGLLSIFNYLLGLHIGQFIIGCIAFIIFYNILKTFMPVIYSSNSTEKTYTHIKNKREKFSSFKQKDLNSDKWESSFKDKK